MSSLPKVQNFFLNHDHHFQAMRTSKCTTQCF
uniref:Uncharacterized protein n=1 Tax=Arundo donax TaxID=35708 RepID=A0A0A9HBT6_ARUDO